MEYPILTLKKGREKSVVNRHPWIFSGAVQKLSVQPQEGDIISVESVEGKLLGYGFYSEKSQITCRMFEHSLAPKNFEEVDYWVQKIQNALSIRNQLLASETTNAYRIIHAEGDNFPGLIVDKYDDILVLQILIKAIENKKELIADAFEICGFKHLYVKGKSSTRFLEDIDTGSYWLRGGNQTNEIEVLENNIKFSIDFVGGQKTGFFLDQRENRALVGKISKGLKVLNTFSYSGGFTLYALKGGAALVHSVDISKDAMDICIQNAALNNLTENHVTTVADCFEFLKNMPENEYDVIILDPPAFAKNKKAVMNASRGYKQINLQAFRRIKPGGMVFTFSCSQNISQELFQKIVFSAAADSHRNVRILETLGQPLDHPVNIYHPESFYLKGLWLRVD
jgi:23S rRNA (cytosine1962-C5)-methyltransferase